MGAEASMTPDAQHRAVLDHLGRREQIAADTRAMLERRDDENALDPLANIDPAMEEAAENLGCTGFRRFRKITLPLIMPGLFAGGTIVFIWPQALSGCCTEGESCL
jgi:hypothetical protein